MAWIGIISEAEADEGFGKLYDEARDPRNAQLDNILQIHSLNPAGLAALPLAARISDDPGRVREGIE